MVIDKHSHGDDPHLPWHMRMYKCTKSHEKKSNKKMAFFLSQLFCVQSSNNKWHMPGFQKNQGTRVNNLLVMICWSCWDMPWKERLFFCTGCLVGIAYTLLIVIQLISENQPVTYPRKPRNWIVVYSLYVLPVRTYYIRTTVQFLGYESWAGSRKSAVFILCYSCSPSKYGRALNCQNLHRYHQRRPIHGIIRTVLLYCTYSTASHPKFCSFAHYVLRYR